MEHAIEAVNSEKLNVTEAAKVFNVPWQTLNDMIKFVVNFSQFFPKYYNILNNHNFKISNIHSTTRITVIYNNKNATKIKYLELYLDI